MCRDGYGARIRSRPRPDLSIAKSDAPDPVVAGGEITYTLTVSNAGPDAATGTTVVDTLPSGATFVSVAASQGSCSGAPTVSCALADLGNGMSATVTIVVRPSMAQTLSNTASVSSTRGDPNRATNSATQTTTVNPAPQCSDGLDNDGDGRVDYLGDPGCLSSDDNTERTESDSADIVYRATVLTSPIVIDEPVTYTLTVTNLGPDPSESVVVMAQFLSDGFSLLPARRIRKDALLREALLAHTTWRTLPSGVRGASARQSARSGATRSQV